MVNMIDSVVNKIGSPKSARKFLSGWISPEGEFISVDMFKHFDELKRRNFYSELFANLEDAMDDEGEYRNEFVNSCGDDHVPWHQYECDNVFQDKIDELRLKIIDRAYADGWTRFGLCKMSTPSNSKYHNVIELEGIKNSLHCLKKDAEFLAELYSCELFLRERIN